ncbi:MAG: RimK family alpha-L-glutamate ligase [Clostridia bacterium]|nr:RimK family alpha-L-glutamate ligase [Clostridia bacterium]
MKNKGVLTVNGFLASESFNELYGFFLDAAKKHGIELAFKKNSELLFDAVNNKPIFDFEADFVLFWDKDVKCAKQLENAHFNLYNCSRGIELCDDKALTHIELSKHDIPMPRTIIAPMTYANIGYIDTDFIDTVIEELGLPLVIKECCGSFGQQVYLAKSRDELIATITQKAGTALIFQEFVETSIARDIRLYVVGGKVIASILRENMSGDFRANVANGAKVSPYNPTDEEKKLAIKACDKLSLAFGGVDLLFGKDGTPLLCEVNSNAHFKGLYECTGVNAAEKITEFIKEDIN